MVSLVYPYNRDNSAFMHVSVKAIINVYLRSFAFSFDFFLLYSPAREA
jgi:hypothetical protein